MGRCAQNAVQRGKLIRNERGNFFQGFPLQCYEQIKTAGNQVHCMHLRVFVNPLRDAVKALTALGCYANLNQRGNLFDACFFPINQCMIAADNALCFHRCHFVYHVNFFYAEDDCQLF